MGFEAKETIKWYEQFDNTNLVIKNNFKDINIGNGHLFTIDTNRDLSESFAIVF